MQNASEKTSFNRVNQLIAYDRVGQFVRTEMYRYNRKPSDLLVAGKYVECGAEDSMVNKASRILLDAKHLREGMRSTGLNANDIYQFAKNLHSHSMKQGSPVLCDNNLFKQYGLSSDVGYDLFKKQNSCHEEKKAVENLISNADALDHFYNLSPCVCVNDILAFATELERATATQSAPASVTAPSDALPASSDAFLAPSEAITAPSEAVTVSS